MRHDVNDDIDREAVGDLLGMILEILVILALPLPTVAVIGVVQSHHHNPASGVEDHPMANLGARNLDTDADVGHLGFFPDLKNAPVARVLNRQFLEV